MALRYLHELLHIWLDLPHEVGEEFAAVAFALAFEVEVDRPGNLAIRLRHVVDNVRCGGDIALKILGLFALIVLLGGKAFRLSCQCEFNLTFVGLHVEEITRIDILLLSKVLVELHKYMGGGRFGVKTCV